MQDLVVILVFVILVPITVLAGSISIARKIIRSRPPVLTPYESHRARFEKSGDYDELYAALEDVESIK